MKANQAAHGTATICRVLGVSPLGYYAWRSRGPWARTRRDEGLGEAIRAIHEDSRGTYGVPRIHAELAAQGWRVSRKRVARLMREAGLAGVSRRRGTRTTRGDSSHRAAADRVERHFQADAPDRLWVADITYVPTGQDCCIWPSCSMCSAAGWWDGRWRIICAPSWCSTC